MTNFHAPLLHQSLISGRGQIVFNIVLEWKYSSFSMINQSQTANLRSYDEGKIFRMKCCVYGNRRLGLLKFYSRNDLDATRVAEGRI